MKIKRYALKDGTTLKDIIYIILAILISVLMTGGASLIGNLIGES